MKNKKVIAALDEAEGKELPWLPWIIQEEP
jgi:hypothetical protein